MVWCVMEKCTIVRVKQEKKKEDKHTGCWLADWLAVFFDDKLTNRKRKQEEGKEGRKEGRHEESKRRVERM